MRHIIIFCLALLAAATDKTVAADCGAEINALFHGGAWDPFVRENRRETTVSRNPDGIETPISDVLWDGPIRSINCTPNGCFMAIGYAFWQGTSFEGPWTRGNDTGTGDPEEFVRGTNRRLADSVSEAQCLGETTLDGQLAILYRFLSKPKPRPFLVYTETFDRLFTFAD